MTTTTEDLKSRFPDLEWYDLPNPEDHPQYTYDGFHPGVTVLEKGHTRSPDRRAFAAETILERDVAITMRDGIKIYADIFRPAGLESAKQVPAILPWSPYGKTGTGVQDYDRMAPFHSGLGLEETSGYEKFEGPDPADWTHRGYAIVNVDARGAGQSEGNIVFWGQQEAEDIYDAIDWISKQPWCNGSVGMAGNSWLSIAQINYASRLSHPALKALAPWEGRNDIYRDSLMRGGRKHNPHLHRFLLGSFAGPNTAENMPAMINNRPFFDEYWESKYIHTENINVPIYIVASFSSQVHCRSSFHTFRTAKSTQKWLRVHPNHEWYDQYRPENVNDLQKYFDRFLKNMDNGWEQDTPRVRLSLLGFEAGGGEVQTVRERPEQDWPLPRQVLKTFYLDSATKSLQVNQPHELSSISYPSQDMHATSDFKLVFDRYTELAGYAKASLWMSCKDHEDLDVAVQIRKISKGGRPIEHLNYPCPVDFQEVPNVAAVKTIGPQGFLRASHAITKVEELSTEQEIFYKHDQRKPIPRGSIIKLEITLWPMGMVFTPGEGIMLRVAGHDMGYPESDTILDQSGNNENVGDHVIYTGGKFASTLILPFI